MAATPALMMIADDLTGAFDTGVQFEKRGASVAFATLPQLADALFDADVIVVDAETRHDSADAAYAKVAQAVGIARAHGVERIYIKTDSGLRGQVGASIKAAMDGMGCTKAAFAPAYPDMKRITKGGVQFIDGVPVHESAFGRDPFDPVRAPTVEALLTPAGLSARVMPVGAAWDASADVPTVMVFDTAVNEDFLPITAFMQASGPWPVMAGCAAFAAYLQPVLGLEAAPRPVQVLPAPLRVVCGSVHPVTRGQVLYAQAHGFDRLMIPPLSLAAEDFFHSEEGRTLQDTLRQAVASHRPLAVDTGLERVQTDNLTALRQGVAGHLGRLVRDMLLWEEGQRGTVMIIGGDTLMGFLSLLDKPGVRLEGEYAPGVVVFSVMLGGRRVRLLSKSGGFGGENLLEMITETMIKA